MKKISKKTIKYQKPKISSKKVKISFFLSEISVIDQFNIVGTVYAQSGWGGCNTGNCGTSATC